MSRITEILHALVKNFASLENDSDGSYWWGHDTNLGDQEEAFKQAEQAITDLLNEAIGEDETHWTDHFDIEHNVPTDRMNDRNELRHDIRTKLGLTTKENQ